MTIYLVFVNLGRRPTAHSLIFCQTRRSHSDTSLMYLMINLSMKDNREQSILPAKAAVSTGVTSPRSQSKYESALARFSGVSSRPLLEQ